MTHEAPKNGYVFILLDIFGYKLIIGFKLKLALNITITPVKLKVIYCICINKRLGVKNRAVFRSFGAIFKLFEYANINFQFLFSFSF